MNARQTRGPYGGLPASLTPLREAVCSPCPRGPEEIEVPKIYTTVLHTSCTVIISLSITFRINNIWNRYHPLRMTGFGLGLRYYCGIGESVWLVAGADGGLDVGEALWDVVGMLAARG